VLCDRLYGGRVKINELELIPRNKFAHDMGQADPSTSESILERQALHAHRLAFAHPTTGERMQFEAPLPSDIDRTLAALRRWRAK
jgi:23S rRNA pseudouridine1911/1915/1917 synthase